MCYTNREILQIAMEQSAMDAGCRAEDFKKDENIVVISGKREKARKYLELPFVCHLISYGSNIVASVDEKYRDMVQGYIDSYPAEHCFETPNLHVLNDALQREGMRICFMAEYFLPDLQRLEKLSCEYRLQVLYQNDFAELYTEEWRNALCEKRRELDVLGVGAFDGEKLIGLAACSADCEDMWQIGVDVLPEYRRKGVASAVTTHLAVEILNEGKVPFYCAAWSNLKSVRNAIKSGFRPAWVEMTAKEQSVVERLNRIAQGSTCADQRRELVKCEMEHLEPVWSLYERVVDHLEKTVNYPKWSKEYPSRENVYLSIQKGEQYACMENGRVVGTMVLNDNPGGNYDAGDWSRSLSRGEYLVIHTLAVDVTAEHRGVGSYLVDASIKIAREKGYQAVRLDVVPGNEPASRLYKRKGFLYAGEKDLQRDPPDIPKFELYELNL